MAKKKCAGMDDWVGNLKKMKKESKANAKKCPELLKELCEQGSEMLDDIVDYAIDGVDEVKEMGVCL